MKTVLTILLGVSVWLGVARAEDNRTFSIQLTVPDGGWKIRIERISRVGDELWVVSRLTRSPDMAIQMISQATDRVHVAAPDLPVKHFVLGKTWTWKNREAATFLDDLTTIGEALKSGTALFERRDEAAPSSPVPPAAP